MSWLSVVAIACWRKSSYSLWFSDAIANTQNRVPNVAMSSSLRPSLVRPLSARMSRNSVTWVVASAVVDEPSELDVVASPLVDVESSVVSVESVPVVVGESSAVSSVSPSAASSSLLAAAVNSPVFLQHRLWHETRIALLQQSVDVRSETRIRRRSRHRVGFGAAWLEGSVIELFRDDLARFRPVVAADTGEPSTAILERGELPPLRALCLHNGTVYRWNRPCYGVANGRAHLRIENRVLPAGPTVVDQVANAAFLHGMVLGLLEPAGDVAERLSIDDARQNLVVCARYGLDARVRWLDGESVDVGTLVLGRLLPAARRGLEQLGVDRRDADRYLGVIERRVASGRTGARWALDSLARMPRGRRGDGRWRALTEAMLQNQLRGEPVDSWEPAAGPSGDSAWRPDRRVADVMTTDLFTVRPDDLVELTAELMDWKHVRHVPVEDDQGRLVGLVTHRTVLRVLASGQVPPPVRDVMRTDVETIDGRATVLEAMERMRDGRLGCLPVVEDGQLVGIVTEHDLVELVAGLLERELAR